MKPLIGLNLLTIKQCKDFEEKIEIAGRAGFDGIELRGNEVNDYLKAGHNLTDIADLLKKNGLAIIDMGSIAGWQFTNHPALVCRLKLEQEESNEKLNDELNKLFERAANLGCQYIPAISAINETGEFEKGVEDFAEVCDLAAEYNLKVAFEFVGFSKQMNNLKIANKLIKEAGRDNGGLLFDTFHFYRGNCSLKDLDQTPDEKIFIVHFNDVMDKPREIIRDQDRLYPGLGVVNLKEIVEKLKYKGYQGFYSAEIFNEDYWQDDPFKVALESRKTTEKILSCVY